MPTEDVELHNGAWVQCEMCQDFWCLTHKMHAHDCPCPAIEEWMEAGKWPYGDPPPGQKPA